MHAIVGDGAMPHIRAASHLVVGYALQQHEQRHGARTVVFLGVRELAWLTHETQAPSEPVPRDVGGRLTMLLIAAAERTNALPGWRILLDRSARRPRLRCERVLDATTSGAGGAAPA